MHLIVGIWIEAFSFDRFTSGTLIMNQWSLHYVLTFVSQFPFEFVFAIFNRLHVCLSWQLSAIFLLERTDFLPERRYINMIYSNSNVSYCLTSFINSSSPPLKKRQKWILEWVWLAKVEKFMYDDVFELPETVRQFDWDRNSKYAYSTNCYCFQIRWSILTYVPCHTCSLARFDSRD